jgi:hypothetical protein
MAEPAGWRAKRVEDGEKEGAQGMISATSPNLEGVAGTDSGEVWIRTETSAILVMSASVLGTVLFFFIKEAYF